VGSGWVLNGVPWVVCGCPVGWSFFEILSIFKEFLGSNARI